MIVVLRLTYTRYVITYMRPKGNLHTHKTGVSEHRKSSDLLQQFLLYV